MSVQIDIDQADSLTAAAIGEPGNRTFYLQARKDDLVVSVVLEKQQVALLSAHVDEFLEKIGGIGDGGPDPDGLNLVEPVSAEFRVGRLGLGHEEDRDLVVLQCEEFVDEDDPDAGLDEPGRLRVWATRGQMNAMARRGEIEVAGGRPICTQCGQPKEPEGHFCPRSNGHREVTRLA